MGSKGYTSMGHAHHYIVNPLVSSSVYECFHAWDQGLTAVQAEPLGSAVLLGQEAFKHLAPSQSVQNMQLLVGRVFELQELIPLLQAEFS